jgi:hypothetical protein
MLCVCVRVIVRVIFFLVQIYFKSKLAVVQV